MGQSGAQRTPSETHEAPDLPRGRSPPWEGAPASGSSPGSGAPAGEQPTRHNPPPATPAPRTAPSGSSRGGVGGSPPLRQPSPPLGHQKTRRLPPRPLQTELARTASGPPPLTRGHPRALLHMCRVSPPGRSASHGAPRHGAGGTAGFQRNRPAGRRLWRPARATAQARQPGPPRNGSPVQGGLSGRTTRNATTQRVPP